MRAPQWLPPVRSTQPERLEQIAALHIWTDASVRADRLACDPGTGSPCSSSRPAARRADSTGPRAPLRGLQEWDGVAGRPGLGEPCTRRGHAA